jgi:hypothetical protein
MASKKPSKRTTPGNPVDSPWYSTPKDARNRKPIGITLSDEGRAALDALAEERGESRSAIVESLVLRAAGQKK